MWGLVSLLLFIVAVGFAVYWAVKDKRTPMYKSGEGKIAIVLLVLAVIGGGISLVPHGTTSATQKTPLKVLNVSDGEAQAKRNGDFAIKVKSSQKARVTANYTNYNNENTGDIEVSRQGNGQYIVRAYIAPSQKTTFVDVHAVEGKLKKNTKNLILDSNPDVYKAYKDRTKKANAVQAKRESLKEAKQDSIEDESHAKMESEKSAARKAKVNSEYPDVTSLFGSSRLTSLSNSKLMSHGVRFTSEIIDLGADSQSQYHVLLKANNTYVLMVEDHSKTGKLAKGDTITVYGMFNGKSRVNAAQINTGISSEYYSEPDVLFMADKVVNQDE